VIFNNPISIVAVNSGSKAALYICKAAARDQNIAAKTMHIQFQKVSS